MARRKKPFPDTPETQTIQKRLETWKSRVSRAQRTLKDWERQYKVEELEQFFYGQQYPAGEQGIVLNHMWASVKTLKPNIFYATPKFYVRPKPGRKTPAEQEKATLAEGLLEAIASQEQNLKKAANLAVLQAFWRIGVLKVIYDPRDVENPEVGKPIYQVDEAGNPIMASSGLAIPLIDRKTGTPILEPKKVMTDDAYRFEWVDACNMLLPDQGPDPAKWTWIGEIVTVPLADAKEDARFKGRSGLTANASRLQGAEAKRKPVEDEEECFRYLECYDLKKRRYCIWADGQETDDFLVDDVLPEGVEDHPYALLLGYTPILGPKDSPWPFPFIHPWRDPQYEYNVRRNQIMEGAKRSARKIGYDENTFDNEEEARKALNSCKDFEAVKLQNVKNPPVMFDEKAINPTILADIPLLQTDWRTITGQPATRQATSGSEFATDSMLAERSANLRDTDMQDTINDWLSVAGEKMLQRVKATLTFEMMVKLRGTTNEDVQKYFTQVYQMPPEVSKFFPALEEAIRERFGKERWQRVSREDLEFEADVTVVPGSARPRNLDVERQQWFRFLQLLGQYPQLALNRELLRYTFKMFDALDERLLDELTATAQQSIQIAANQAGRNQGGAGNGGGANPMQGDPRIAAVMQAMGGGATNVA